MPLTLEIKDPNGKPVGHAYSPHSFNAACAIVNEESETKDWFKAKYPHTTKVDHQWTVYFTDAEPELVTLPAGSTIDMYR